MTTITPHTMIINSNDFEILLETVQCVWEAVENRLIQANNKDAAELIREVVGTPGLRSMFREMDLLNACDEGWKLIQGKTEGSMIPYDWKYVPWFINECLEWNTKASTVTLRDNWKTRCLCKTTE